MPLPPLVPLGPVLDRSEVARYARHLLLPGFGAEAQRRLRRASVLVVGAGGLGAPVLGYLAAAGVGRIGIADPDVIEASNLQRQILHRADALGTPKVASAAAFVTGLNPDVEVVQYPVRVDETNAAELVGPHDLVIDGTDNFPTRYLLGDTCVRLGRPYVWASILRWDGQVSVFWSDHGPCLRCVFPAPPDPGLVPSCAEGGVLGVVCGSVGSAQAAEAIKIITGTGEPLVGRLAVFSASTGAWQQLPIARDPRCPACGDATASSAAQAQGGTGLPPAPLIEPADLVSWLAARERGERDFVLVDVRGPGEREINQIPGAVTEDAVVGLSPEVALVVHCKSGGRSARAAARWQAERSGAVHDLAGGIDAWIRDVDPSLPTY